MSQKSGENLDEDAKEPDDIEAAADKEIDENEEVLDQHDNKSEDRGLPEEEMVEVVEEEEEEEEVVVRSQTDVKPQKLEAGEESAGEEESVHSHTSKDSKVRETKSSQKIWDTDHEESSKIKLDIETGLDVEEEEETEEDLDQGGQDEMDEEMLADYDQEEEYEEEEEEEEYEEEEEELKEEKKKDLRREEKDEDEDEYEEDEEEEDEEDEEEEEEEEPPEVKKRKKLLRDYKMAMADQKRLHDLNRKLQNKLAAQLRKTEHELNVQTEEEILEQEQQYVTSMRTLNELHENQEQLEENRALELETLRQESHGQRALAETYMTKLINYRKHAATGGNKNKKSGRYRRAEQYAQTEREKWTEASKVTLDNILVKEEYDKIAKILKEREKVAEGLTMADFEQLKIENQGCNEKIEEKNETIGQVRVKLREAVQRLTHVKQKLHFINVRTRDERTNLEEVEERVIVRRQILSKTKVARDRLKRDSRSLRQKSALLCFPDLLRDYEKKLDETDTLRVQVAGLRISHKDTTMEIRKLRHKINELKSITEETGERY